MLKEVKGEIQEKIRKELEYELLGKVYKQEYEEWRVLVDGRIRKFIIPKYTNYKEGDYVQIEYTPIPNYISYYDFLFELHKKTRIQVRTGGIIASGISKRVRDANF